MTRLTRARRQRLTKRPLDERRGRDHQPHGRVPPIVPRGEGLAVTDDAARNVCRVECNVARHRRLRLRRGRGGRGARRGPATRWWSSRRATTSRRQDYTSFEGPSMNQLYEFGGSVRHHDERRRAAPGRIQYGRRRLSGELVGLPQQDARVRAQGVGDQTTHGFPLFASSDYAAAMDKVFERLGVTSGCTEEGLQNKVLRKGPTCAPLSSSTGFHASFL
ncbi:hypothetical protein OsI_23104 [Oryza sativa Indica Group]|uniref:Glucose-methanol-choline oxidoreductase N-terminal domain-containing protein n=1 Tax=Oryza sativa subsp. indica TaxID=39946 RepID=B8B2V1_ORYSI|nr:hypothetical protein OsI_23104 [Oryza sativa Indica Group]